MIRRMIRRSRVLRIGVPTVLMAAGKLRVVTASSPHSYHVYRNQSGGVDYELAREFADRLEIRGSGT